MSKEIAIQSNNNYGIAPSLWAVLSQSTYRGVKPESIKMAYDYCMEQKINPLKKFIHIVPRMINNQLVDTIVEGIGLHRSQAIQSGKYVGLTEPEYGPIITKDFGDGDKDFSYPEWCKITVRKLIEGRIAEFTALEYWIENYAPLSKSSKVPNVMWKKRPRAQLAKCTEAHALRKAFQEEISAEATFEEMEGKTFENFKDVTASSTQILSQKLDALLTAQKININSSTSEVIDSSIIEDSPVNNEPERAILAEAIKIHDISEELIAKWCANENINSLDELPLERVRKYIDHINTKKGNSA